MFIVVLQKCWVDGEHSIEACWRDKAGFMDIIVPLMELRKNA
jgi:hypothetical protein